MTSTFPQRKIGDTLVSAIGLGCMGMSIPSSTGPPDEEQCFQVLTLAADMGITFWDTSDAYGNNEEIIGRWLRKTGRRNEIFLATKFGVKRDGAKQTVDGTPAYVKQACEKSLQRLGVDYVDLYYQHRVDAKTPIETTVAAMAELVREGKVRHLGISECSARTLQRACSVHPIAAAQMEYSLLALEIEDEQTRFLDTARELGVKIVPYSPLGRGFLTGAIKSRDDMDPGDMRLRMHPRFSEEYFGGNLKLVEEVEAIAKEKACTTSQLALAWVLAQGEDFIPIPGTKHVKYLVENAGAANVMLSAEDDRRIRAAVERAGGRKGPRYSEVLSLALFGDTPEL